MREYVGRLLRADGYQVMAVSDGQLALDTIRADLPDIVVSDVMMPRLDGLALVAALRSDARTAAVPVLLLSARAGQESAIDALQAGADDYLVKPFAAAELPARVRANGKLARIRNHVVNEPHGKYTVPVTHPDGHLLWITVTFNRVEDLETGRRVIVGTLRDVTAEHYTVQRETALAALNPRLALADTLHDAVQAAAEGLLGVSRAGAVGCGTDDPARDARRLAQKLPAGARGHGARNGAHRASASAGGFRRRTRCRWAVTGTTSSTSTVSVSH